MNNDMAKTLLLPQKQPTIQKNEADPEEKATFNAKPFELCYLDSVFLLSFGSRLKDSFWLSLSNSALLVTKGYINHESNSGDSLAPLAVSAIYAGETNLAMLKRKLGVSVLGDTPVVIRQAHCLQPASFCIIPSLGQPRDYEPEDEELEPESDEHDW